MIITAEQLDFEKGIKELGLPDLTSTMKPIIAPLKLSSYSNVTEVRTPDGNLKFRYKERPLITPRLPSSKRRRIASQKVIDALSQKLVSSRWADKIVRLLEKAPNAKHSGRKYHYFKMIPPDARSVCDFVTQHAFQTAILLWLKRTDETDSTVFGFNTSEQEALRSLRHSEKRFWEDQKSHKEYLEKHKGEYDNI